MGASWLWSNRACAGAEATTNTALAARYGAEDFRAADKECASTASRASCPGGGLAPDGARWVARKPGFFLPVRVLSRLFRRRFLGELATAHHTGRLQFFGEYAEPSDPRAFAACSRATNAALPSAGRITAPQGRRATRR